MASLTAGAIEGVKQGFTKKLQIEGVGYRASLEGKNLVLSIGFSHPIKFEPPANVKVTIEKNVITVFGPSKVQVGQAASQIRKFRKPDPYQGKGIRYVGEIVRRKAGKKAVATTG